MATLILGIIIIVLIFGFHLGNRYQRESRRWKMQRFRELQQDLDLDLLPNYYQTGYPRHSDRSGIPDGIFDLFLIIVFIGAGVFIFTYVNTPGTLEDENSISAKIEYAPPGRTVDINNTNTTAYEAAQPDPENVTPASIPLNQSGEYELNLALQQDHTLQAGYFTNKEGAMARATELSLMVDEIIFLWESETAAGMEYRVLTGAAPSPTGLAGLSRQLENHGIDAFLQDLQELRSTGYLTLVN